MPRTHGLGLLIAAGAGVAACTNSTTQTLETSLQKSVSTLDGEINDPTIDGKLSRDRAGFVLAVAKKFEASIPPAKAGDPPAMALQSYKRTTTYGPTSAAILKLEETQAFVAFVCAPASEDRSAVRLTGLLSTDLNMVAAGIAPASTNFSDLIDSLSNADLLTKDATDNAQAVNAGSDAVAVQFNGCVNQVNQDLTAVLEIPYPTAKTHDRLAFLAIPAAAAAVVGAFDAAKTLLIDVLGVADEAKRWKMLSAAINDPSSKFATNVTDVLGPTVYSVDPTITTSGSADDQQKQIAAKLKQVDVVAGGAEGKLKAGQLDAIIDLRRQASLIAGYVHFRRAIANLGEKTGAGTIELDASKELSAVNADLADYDKLLPSAPSNSIKTLNSMREGFWQLRRVAAGDLTTAEQKAALSQAITKLSSAFNTISKQFNTNKTDIQSAVKALEKAAQ